MVFTMLRGIAAWGDNNDVGSVTMLVGEVYAGFLPSDP